MELFKTIPNYPRQKDGRAVFVSYPLLVTEAVINHCRKHKLDCAESLVLGEYVPVNLKEKAYLISKFAKSCHFDKCEAVCKHRNYVDGYTEQEAKEVLSAYEHNTAILNFYEQGNVGVDFGSGKSRTVRQVIRV